MGITGDTGAVAPCAHPALWLSPSERGAPSQLATPHGLVLGWERGWCSLTVHSSACWERCPHIPTTVSPVPF